MHLRNKLNVKKIANLTKPNVYSDGGGLYLRIRPTGTKSWLFICMINGKRREIGLGSTLDVTLANARTLASELRQLQLSGQDPMMARKQSKIEVAPIPTFREVARDLIDGIEGGFKNEKHRKQWRSTIATYAAPILEKPVDQIHTTDVLALLQPIWLAKAETASRVRQRIERILDAATVQGHRSGDNPARLKGNLEFLLPRQAKAGESHHEALPYAAVPPFMAELRERPALAARTLEFAILTAARTGEVLGMRWGEVDFERCKWEVPADRMKAGRAHEVPLTSDAIAILEQIKPTEPPASGLVFGGPRGGPLSNMAMLNLLKRMHTPATVHGFRSSFRDWAGEATSYAREEIEMALAHTIASKAERAYRRGTALDKRRALMDDWGAYLRGAPLKMSASSERTDSEIL